MSRKPTKLIRDRLHPHLMAMVDASLAKIVPIEDEAAPNTVSVTVTFGGKRKRLRAPVY